MANSFFKNGDKAYSENLNDSVLVGNAFDWTVTVSLPDDTGEVFPNSSTVVKGKVADLSITANSNLSIGSTISNSSGSSQVYRLTVYPDFNRFGGFQSITLTGDATFYIANKGGTSPIANNLDYTDLSDVPELKVLKEYDIVVTIPNNKSVTSLEFVFQSSSADVSSSINQSNISGLNDRLNTIESDISNMIDLIYPVGSIYMSVNDVNPQTLFGGTWVALEDRFLIGASNTYENGAKGGEATHTLTTNEMPSHTHIQNSHNHTQNAHRHRANNEDTTRKILVVNKNVFTTVKRQYTAQTTGDGLYYVEADADTGISEYEYLANATATNQSNTATNQNTGGGQAHNNMPPYLSVYMWKRTA